MVHQRCGQAGVCTEPRLTRALYIALNEINRLNSEPPPLFSTVDPTAVIYVPKTHP